MQETLHNHNCSNESMDNFEALEIGSRVVGKERTNQKKEKLLLNWPLMSSIIIFCVFSLHDGAYHEVYYINWYLTRLEMAYLSPFVFVFLLLCIFKWTTFIHLVFFRFSRYGLWVLKDWGVWTLQPMMLVMFFQYQVLLWKQQRKWQYF